MFAYAIFSVIIVSLLSLLGAAFLVVKRSWLTRMMSPLLALSSGVLLGSTFFDLIPESLKLVPNQAMVFILFGIVSFFSLEKILQWHHHVEGDYAGESKSVGYLSLFGDGIHNFVDGTIIAASYLVSPALGISATIAVIAHEIPHELADFTILLHSGMRSKQALFYNFLSATTAIIGALIVFVVNTQAFINVLIPFAAGNFLYIAMSDLIPELHRRRSQLGSLIHIIALISGVLLVYFLPS